MAKKSNVRSWAALISNAPVLSPQEPAVAPNTQAARKLVEWLIKQQPSRVAFFRSPEFLTVVSVLLALPASQRSHKVLRLVNALSPFGGVIAQQQFRINT